MLESINNILLPQFLLRLRQTNRTAERLALRWEEVITKNFMSPENKIEADKLNPKTDLLPSVAASCYAIFRGQGGYPIENEHANATFEVGKQYLITGGSISQSSTSLEIEGFGGGWNSVLFDFDWEVAPLKFSYLISRHNA